MIHRRMHPPFSFALPKENPPEGLLLPLRGNSPSGPCTVQKKRRLCPALRLDKYGSGRNRCGRDLLAFIRLRYTAVEHAAFMPQLAAWQRLSDARWTVPASTPAAAPFAINAEAPSLWDGFQRESGEAPPVADAARAFRGSGAIGGPAKGPGIAMPRRCKGRSPSFGRFKGMSRRGKSKSPFWCLFLHGHRALSPHREEMPEAPPVADAARAFRGSGAIGGPAKGPGIAMPRRCSEGGGGSSTTMVEFSSSFSKLGQVYSCGNLPHFSAPNWCGSRRLSKPALPPLVSGALLR